MIQTEDANQFFDSFQCLVVSDANLPFDGFQCLEALEPLAVGQELRWLKRLHLWKAPDQASQPFVDCFGCWKPRLWPCPLYPCYSSLLPASPKPISDGLPRIKPLGLFPQDQTTRSLCGLREFFISERMDTFGAHDSTNLHPLDLL